MSESSRRKVNVTVAFDMRSPDWATPTHELYAAVDPAIVTQILDWFRANDRTLTADEASAAREDAVALAAERFGAVQR